jgi:hypothetical protein
VPGGLWARRPVGKGAERPKPREPGRTWRPGGSQVAHLVQSVRFWPVYL